jgi:5'-methylthioadenosine phosphorylase
MLAIIGGSGLTQLANLDISRREVARTPYGDPSGALTFGSIGGQKVVFIARHGYGHTIPPHLVNYRANIWALVKAANAGRIVSVASVGGIRADLAPGAVVVPHQIIDYTHGRNSSFFEGGDSQVVHVDFTHPYDAFCVSSFSCRECVVGSPCLMALCMLRPRGHVSKLQPRSIDWSVMVPKLSA